MASNQTTLPNVSENEETLLTGVNENVYEDQSIGAELTKKDINRVAWRSMLLQASFNYERNASYATYGTPHPAIGEHSDVITQFFNLPLSFLSMITDFVLFPFSPLNFRFLFYRF